MYNVSYIKFFFLIAFYFDAHHIMRIFLINVVATFLCYPLIIVTINLELIRTWFLLFSLHRQFVRSFSLMLLITRYT